MLAAVRSMSSASTRADHARWASVRTVKTTLSMRPIPSFDARPDPNSAHTVAGASRRSDRPRAPTAMPRRAVALVDTSRRSPSAAVSRIAGILREGGRHCATPRPGYSPSARTALGAADPTLPLLVGRNLRVAPELVALHPYP